MLRSREERLFVYGVYGDLQAGLGHSLFIEFEGPKNGHELVAPAGQPLELRATLREIRSLSSGTPIISSLLK